VVAINNLVSVIVDVPAQEYRLYILLGQNGANSIFLNSTALQQAFNIGWVDRDTHPLGVSFRPEPHGAYSEGNQPAASAGQLVDFRQYRDPLRSSVCFPAIVSVHGLWWP